MEKLVEFTEDYFVLFLVISIFLIFALIGYIVDNRKKNITKEIINDINNNDNNDGFTTL